MKNNIHLCSFLVQSVLEWEMFETKVVEKFKTNTLCSVIFFSENRAVCEIIWQTSVEWATDENTVHAHYMLGT
jgi:hypothetical protein